MLGCRIIGQGLVAHLASRTLRSVFAPNQKTPQDPLHYSLITHRRMHWLNQQKLAPSQSSPVLGMEIFCGQASLDLGLDHALGHIVHHATWLDEIAHAPQRSTDSASWDLITHLEAADDPIQTWTERFPYPAQMHQVSHHESHQQKARQWFTPYGIVGSLPLSDPHQSLWIVMPQHPAFELDRVGIQEHLGAFCIQQSSAPQALQSRWRFPIYTEQSLLLGQARCQLHPLAGQGLNATLYALENLQKRQDQAADFNSLALRHQRETHRHLQRLFLLTHMLLKAPTWGFARLLPWLKTPGIRTMLLLLADPTGP